VEIVKKNKITYHYGFAIYSEDQAEGYECRFLNKLKKQQFLEYLVEKKKHL